MFYIKTPIIQLQYLIIYFFLFITITPYYILKLYSPLFKNFSLLLNTLFFNALFLLILVILIKAYIKTFYTFIILLLFSFRKNYYLSNIFEPLSLYDGFITIHPYFFYTALILAFNLLISCTTIKLTEYINNYWFSILNLFFSFFALLSGSFWSCSQTTWGIWWTWDPIEVALLFLVIYITVLIHISFIIPVVLFQSITILFCLSSLGLIRYGFLPSRHSFMNFTPSNFLFFLFILILIFGFFPINLKSCLYFNYDLFNIIVSTILIYFSLLFFNIISGSFIYYFFVLNILIFLFFKKFYITKKLILYSHYFVIFILIPFLSPSHYLIYTTSFINNNYWNCINRNYLLQNLTYFENNTINIYNLTDYLLISKVFKKGVVSFWDYSLNNSILSLQENLSPISFKKLKTDYSLYQFRIFSKVNNMYVKYYNINPIISKFEQSFFNLDITTSFIFTVFLLAILFLIIF